MRACAECIPACAWACARARARNGGSASGARRPSSRYHCAHVYHYMSACAHVHMYACARSMHSSVRGRGRGRGRGRARRERASTNCVSLRTFYIDVYLYMNVGRYGRIIVCLYTCVCVCVCLYFISIDVHLYMASVHAWMHKRRYKYTVLQRGTPHLYIVTHIVTVPRTRTRAHAHAR